MSALPAVLGVVASLNRLLDAPAAGRLGWVLLHFLWQGCLVAALVACLLVILRRRRPVCRYAVACCALLLLVICPLVMYVFLLDASGERAEPLTALDVRHVAQERLADGERERSPTTVAPGDATGEKSVLDAVANGTAPVASVREKNGVAPGSSPDPAAITDRFRALLQPVLPWIVVVWFLGVAVLSLRLLGGWLYVQRLTYRSVKPAGRHLRDMVRDLSGRMGITRKFRLFERIFQAILALNAT